MFKQLIKTFREPDGLRSKTLVAAFWSLIGSVGRGGIRLASNLILTRLLVPEDFGLMATAMVVVTLIQILSDTGVKTALVQNPRGHEPVFINNSFIIAIGRSLLLFVILWFLKAPMAQYFGIPQLESVLSILSLAVILEGFLNPALPLLIKSLKIQKQVIYAVGSQFVGFVFTLMLAILFRSVLALAVGYALTSLSRVVISYLVFPYRPRLVWDKVVGKELFHFGKYILLNTLVTWTALNIDRLIIGKVLGMEKLGIYNLALYLGVFASDILVQVFAQSYFPAMSSIAHDLKKVTRIYGQTVRSTIWIATPLLLLLALLSDTVVAILYDPRYAEAGIVLFWIALRSTIQTLNHIQSGTILALGKPLQVSISNALGLVLLVLSLPGLSMLWGLSGSGVALLLSMLLITAVQSVFLIKTLQFPVSLVLKPWLNMIMIALCFGGISLILKSLNLANLDPSLPWALGLFSLMVASMLYLARGIAFRMLKPRGRV